LRKLNIQPGSANPPYYARIPAAMGYLRCFIADDAYMPTRGGTEGDKSYKWRLYSTLKELSDNAAPPKEMRIVKKMADNRLESCLAEPCRNSISKVRHCTLVQSDS